jgi:hypothetical protein
MRIYIKSSVENFAEKVAQELKIEITLNKLGWYVIETNNEDEDILKIYKIDPNCGVHESTPKKNRVAHVYRKMMRKAFNSVIDTLESEGIHPATLSRLSSIHEINLHAVYEDKHIGTYTTLMSADDVQSESESEVSESDSE